MPANFSSEAAVDVFRAEPACSWTAANRSRTDISPVGTTRRASVNAFGPEVCVRVLTTMDARKVSTGAPNSR
uniref:Unannotated protein n=1 Tax=freshwater metagenome TaxID=449393 RepID=A0A6J7MSL3_9ZZZZ